jgi:hypothetical protein
MVDKNAEMLNEIVNATQSTASGVEQINTTLFEMLDVLKEIKDLLLLDSPSD